MWCSGWKSVVHCGRMLHPGTWGSGAVWQWVRSVAVGQPEQKDTSRPVDTCRHVCTQAHLLSYIGACSEIHRDTDTDLQSEPVSKESFAVLQTQIKSTTGLVAARANAIFLACTTQGIPKCIGMRAQIHYSALKNSCDVKLLH